MRYLHDVDSRALVTREPYHFFIATNVLQLQEVGDFGD